MIYKDPIMLEHVPVYIASIYINHVVITHGQSKVPNMSKQMRSPKLAATLAVAAVPCTEQGIKKLKDEMTWIYMNLFLHEFHRTSQTLRSLSGLVVAIRWSQFPAQSCFRWPSHSTRQPSNMADMMLECVELLTGWHAMMRCKENRCLLMAPRLKHLKHPCKEWPQRILKIKSAHLVLAFFGIVMMKPVPAWRRNNKHMGEQRGKAQLRGVNSETWRNWCCHPSAAPRFQTHFVIADLDDLAIRMTLADRCAWWLPEILQVSIHLEPKPCKKTRWEWKDRFLWTRHSMSEMHVPVHTQKKKNICIHIHVNTLFLLTTPQT